MSITTKTEAAPKASMLDKIKSLGVPGLCLVVAGFAAQSFLPWWSIAIVGFIGGAIFSKTYGEGYALGFLAFSILWAAYAAFLSSANNHLMAGNISKLFGGAISATYFSYLSGLIGGLTGGFATASGALFRGLLKK